MPEENCKGCTASVWIAAEETYQKLVKTLLREEDAAEKTEYSRRLTICKACPSLVYGTTCRHCGCLVHARALTKASRCPNPGDAKW
jgi:predicted Zn-ribbon and HTH transcriptional regulator